MSREYAYNYFVERGVSPQVAAGIVGNLAVESGDFDPRVISGERRGDNGSAHYVQQLRGERLKNYKSWTKETGQDPKSLDSQLGFVLEELDPKSPYKDAIASSKRDKILNAKSPEAASQNFMQYYERAHKNPKINHIAKRNKIAMEVASSAPTNTEFNTAGLPQGDVAPIPADKPQITLANAEAPTLAGMTPTGYAPQEEEPVTPLDSMLGIEPKSRQERGPGFAALVPSDTYDNQQIAKIIPVSEYNPSAGRSLMPTSSVVEDYATAVARHFGPDYSVGVVSGMEPKGAPLKGSPENHPAGLAADMDIIDPNGNRVTGENPEDAENLRKTLVDMAVLNHPVGFGDGYMKKGRAHIGGPSHKLGWGKNYSHTSLDPGLKSDLIRARETGVNHYWDVPTPASREEAFSGEPFEKPFESKRTPTDVNEFASAQDAAQRQVSRTPIDAFGFEPSQQGQKPQRDPEYSDYDNYRMNERTAPKEVPSNHADEFWGLSAPEENIARNDAGLPTSDIPMPFDPIPTPANRPADLDFREKEETDITKDDRVRGNKFTQFGATALGNMVGGPVGALAGRFLEDRWAKGKQVNPLAKGTTGQNFWSSFLSAKDPIEKFAALGNNSSNRMQNAMTGPRGATYTASNGSQATSLGNGQYIYYSPKSGKTSIKGEINMNKSADLRDFFSGKSSKDDDE